MPQNQPPLNNIEIEKIRQWVLFGAPQTGIVIQDSTLQRFYGGLGMVTTPPPLPPLETEGFQIRLGRFFRESETEVEYFKKHDLKLPDSLEVNRVEIFMNNQSHHYIIYKFNAGNAASFPEGLRSVNQSPSGASTSLVTTAQFSRNSVLPQGTAFFWPQGTVLDLNYHIVNYNPDSVLAADAYANIYTQPKGTAQAEMHSRLVLFSSYSNPFIFNIPNNGIDKTFTDPFYTPGSTDKWNIWVLSSHTHQWGRDYDIYKRNPDGSKGTQLYEGFYNTGYTFNQGYYDWAHPAVREFDPLETINLSEGLIQEARFNNTGNSNVYFGLTTEDEMMLYIIQYTLNGSGASVNTETKTANSLEIFPNPYKNSTNIKYSIHQPSYVTLEVFNMLGEKIHTIIDENQLPGSYNHHFSAKELGLAGGIYMVSLTINGEITSKKIVELN